MGDDTLFNTLGSDRCVKTLVVKVRCAWNCETMSTGTLKTEPKHKLSAFISLASVHKSLPAWVAGGWKKQVLLLSGTGGLGKTGLACAIMHAVAPAKSFHLINKLDRLRDITFCPGEGLVVDEVCLSARQVDDIKSLLDVEIGRDVECRKKDGHIPAETRASCRRIGAGRPFGPAMLSSTSTEWRSSAVHSGLQFGLTFDVCPCCPCYPRCPCRQRHPGDCDSAGNIEVDGSGGAPPSLSQMPGHFHPPNPHLSYTIPPNNTETASSQDEEDPFGHLFDRD